MTIGSLREINEEKLNSFQCKTNYPIVLVHGTGFRDHKLLNYWGRIPKALESEGAEIFYCNQDAWGTIEENAKVIKQSILDILSETGYDKVNIIAHSKGGMDTRYMICAFEMEAQIASLTTISTPHHGSKTIDFIYHVPKLLLKVIAYFINLYFKILGDKHPDFSNTCIQFTTKYCENFNCNVINSKEVYYQSYASVMRNSFSDILLLLPHFIVKMFEGENDGIISVEAAKWGEFKGVITSRSKRGVSHADMVDLRRMNYSDFDIRNIYIDIVKGLKERGF